MKSGANEFIALQEPTESRVLRLDTIQLGLVKADILVEALEMRWDIHTTIMRRQ